MKQLIPIRLVALSALLASMHFRASAAEFQLAGASLDDETIERAAQAADTDVSAISDIHASAEYRLHLVRVHTKRALQRAAANAAAS